MSIRQFQENQVRIIFTVHLSHVWHEEGLKQAGNDLERHFGTFASQVIKPALLLALLLNEVIFHVL